MRHIRVKGDIAYVPLTQGYEAIIDADDVSIVSGFLWYAKVKASGAYAARRARGPRMVCRTIYMHKEILHIGDGLEVDHADGNTLNNRRANLRPATKSQNQYNQRIRTDNSSGVKGVYWHSQKKMWRAEIKVERCKKHLGFFQSISDAADAYAKASAEFHSEFGRLE